MPRAKWDVESERKYEGGTDRGMIYYPDNTGAYADGEAWNGLTSVDESPSGGEATAFWADNIKYAELMSKEEWAGTINAYSYPERFGQCDGSYELTPGVTIGQQERKSFGFAYRTKVGNARDGWSNYIVHLIYGAKAAPSQKTYNTINDSPEIVEFSWSVTTTPVEVPGKDPTASLDIDYSKLTNAAITAIETVLYGQDAVEADVEHNIEAQEDVKPRLPLPAEVAKIISEATNAAG